MLHSKDTISLTIPQQYYTYHLDTGISFPATSNTSRSHFTVNTSGESISSTSVFIFPGILSRGVATPGLTRAYALVSEHKARVTEDKALVKFLN